MGSRGNISKRSAEAAVTTVPGGAAGGDLAGTYPNPTVLRITSPVNAVLATAGAVAILAVDAAGNVILGGKLDTTPQSANLLLESVGGINSVGASYAWTVGVTLRMTLDAAGQLHVGNDADVANVNLRVNGLTTAGAVIGAGNALPALPEGYLEVNINGTVRKIPYYNV